MTNAPERIWVEDESGDDQWTYGTWDVRNYAEYDVEYVRADRIEQLTAERDRLRAALRDGRRLLAIAQDDRVQLLIQLEQCEKRHE